mgnify:CR=1 FL=1
MTPTATTISVFGAGYVGCVSAACLVQDGHQVIAVDPDTKKIESLAKGLAPIYEPGLDELIAIGHQTGALSATSDYVAAVLASDVSFCCPGTPSREDGSLDTRYVQTVAEQIGTRDELNAVEVRARSAARREIGRIGRAEVLLGCQWRPVRRGGPPRPAPGRRSATRPGSVRPSRRP